MSKRDSYQEYSPVTILTELAVEGTSSFIEAQRIFLNLIQQENNLLLNGVKERIGNSAPAAAVTDLARRSVDTWVDLHQSLLTTTSKQTLQWLESVQNGKGYKADHLVELAREATEDFIRAQKQFVDVLAQETTRATRGKPEPDSTPAQKTELSKLAREAATLFIDAQKKVLDVLGQQMNVNLNAATQAVETLSPTRLVPMAEIPAKAVKSFFDQEAALFQSAVGQSGKKSGVGAARGHSRQRAARTTKSA